MGAARSDLDKDAPRASLPGRPSFRRALQSRAFFSLWSAQLVSVSGDYVFTVALVWLVLESTGSVFNVGLVIAASLVPIVVLGPFLGVLVDRGPRRLILISTNLAEGALVGAFALAVAFHVEVGLVAFLAVSAALGAGGLLVRSTTVALLPLTVARDDLAPANSLMSFTGSFNQVLGLSIGGIVVAIWGASPSIAYDAFTFFVAAGLLVHLASSYNHPPGSAVSRKRFATDFADGFRFIRQHRFVIEVIVLAGSMNCFAVATFALWAPYARLVLDGTAATFGLLGALRAVGAIVGAFIVGKVDARSHSGPYIIGGCFALGISMALVGLTYQVPPALAESVAIGFLFSLINVPMAALIQGRVPSEMLGRVTATFSALVLIEGPIGAVYAGAFASALSVPDVFLISGLVVASIAVVGAAVMSDLRRARY